MAATVPQTDTAGTPQAPKSRSRKAPSLYARARERGKAGDSRGAINVLQDKRLSRAGLELLIESHRAVGEPGQARERMRDYLRRFPNGPRVARYRRLLGDGER